MAFCTAHVHFLFKADIQDSYLTWFYLTDDFISPGIVPVAGLTRWALLQAKQSTETKMLASVVSTAIQP
jgi:hypothetical protein